MTRDTIHQPCPYQNDCTDSPGYCHRSVSQFTALDGDGHMIVYSVVNDCDHENKKKV